MIKTVKNVSNQEWLKTKIRLLQFLNYSHDLYIFFYLKKFLRLKNRRLWEKYYFRKFKAFPIKRRRWFQGNRCRSVKSFYFRYNNSLNFKKGGHCKFLYKKISFLSSLTTSFDFEWISILNYSSVFLSENEVNMAFFTDEKKTINNIINDEVNEELNKEVNGESSVETNEKPNKESNEKSNEEVHEKPKKEPSDSIGEKSLIEEISEIIQKPNYEIIERPNFEIIEEPYEQIDEESNEQIDEESNGQTNEESNEEPVEEPTIGINRPHRGMYYIDLLKKRRGGGGGGGGGGSGGAGLYLSDFSDDIQYSFGDDPMEEEEIEENEKEIEKLNDDEVATEEDEDLYDKEISDEELFFLMEDSQELETYLILPDPIENLYNTSLGFGFNNESKKPVDQISIPLNMFYNNGIACVTTPNRVLNNELNKFSGNGLYFEGKYAHSLIYIL